MTSGRESTCLYNDPHFCKTLATSAHTLTTLCLELQMDYMFPDVVCEVHNRSTFPSLIQTRFIVVARHVRDPEECLDYSWTLEELTSDERDAADDFVTSDASTDPEQDRHMFLRLAKRAYFLCEFLAFTRFGYIHPTSKLCVTRHSFRN